MNTQTHNQKRTIQIEVPAKWDLAGFDNDLYVEALQRSIIHRLKKSNQELDTVLSKILLYTSKYGAFDTFPKNLIILSINMTIGLNGLFLKCKNMN